jgi:carboxylate-amine ligase
VTERFLAARISAPGPKPAPHNWGSVFPTKDREYVKAFGDRVSKGDRLLDRRAGLEQEFFLLENSGHPSERADEFLERCREESAGPVCFAPEFVLGLVEVNTPPVYTLYDLEREYAQNLRIALRTARSLGLRLYPLGTYPLPLEPAVRDGLDYRVQVGTVGPERFVDAGRCAGTHLHLELQAGTVDEGVGISATASAAAREEVSNIYNLATALDPALVAITRSCPFFEGH